MPKLWSDVRLALRSSRKRPGFTAMVVLTLGLGIGATTGIFSLVYGVMLRPLPYPEADRLVLVLELYGPDRQPVSVSYLNFRDWADETATLVDPVVVRYGSTVLTGEGEATRIATLFASPAYFRHYQTAAAHGRLLDESSIRPEDPPPEAVISHTLWRTRFGRDPDLVGRTIRVSDIPLAVVGIIDSSFVDPFAGSGFTGGSAEVDLILPIGFAARFDPLGNLIFERRQVRRFGVYARLADGVTVDQASSELEAIQARLAEQHPDANEGFGVRVRPLAASLVEGLSGPIWVLMIGALILLSIACFNVANILLVRGASRTQEVALRRALGAGRSDLVRQLLVEAVVLGLLGGALGVAVAAVSLEPLLSMAPGSIPTVTRVELDRAVLGWALVVSLLTGLVFGSIPALRGTELQLRTELVGRRSGGVSRAMGRIQSSIVIVEVAVAMILLAAASLVTGSFRALRSVETGYETERILTASVDLPASRYGSPEAQRQFAELLTGRLQERPEAEWADVWGPGRPGLSFFLQTVMAEGMAIRDRSEALASRYHSVEPGGLARMGMRILEGREFTPDDRTENRPVAVVNRSLAEELWPGRTALGQRIRRYQPPGEDRPDNPWVEIVGVVEDAELGGRVPAAGVFQVDFDIFYPLAQRPLPTVTLLVRGVTSAEAVIAPLRETLREMDPQLALYQVATMDANLAAEEGPLRFASLLLGVFAGLALLLAGLGVYGVLSYSVARRTREIGLRAALGARAVQTVSLFVRKGLALAVLGVVLGGLASVGLGGAVARFLMGVGGFDVTTMSVPIIVMLGGATLACVIPAARASRMDPASALREE